jgi:hypothetical protein
MKEFLMQRLVVSILFTLLSLTTSQLWAADAPNPLKPMSLNAPFVVAPSGGNSKVDLKQWNFTALSSGNAWFTQNPPTHQSTGIAYGDFPTRTPGTTNTEFSYAGYLSIAPGSTGASGGQFLTIEGYLIMPCYASSVQLRVKDSLTEQYASLHLAINSGAFTLNSADLTKVSEEKINEANAIVTSSEYTVQSSNYGKWVRFGVAISNGRLAFSSRLEWNLNGGGWATIPSTAFSSITGGTGLLTTTSPLCDAVAPSANCTDVTSTGLSIYASQAAADAAITGSTYTFSDTKPFEDYTAPSAMSHTYCVTYTTGPTETRIGVRNFVSIVSTCSFTRTYSVTKMDCTTPATFVSSGNGSYNSFYYTVEPNTQYRICATVTSFTGTCTSTTTSGGGVFPTILASGTLVFNTTPAPATFTFNCGTASVTGTFIANGVSGQTGTLTVPITSATAGSAIFNVSGTGFTGTLGTNLTAGQTSVVIPITYDGTGAIGSRTLTITSSQGTGTCTKAVSVTTPPTSFSYPFNCTGSTFSGKFIANAITGQTGNVVVPINVTQGGSTTLTVSGTNISGSLTTTIVTGQASVTIPITYTGGGTEGSRLLTITSPDGTGTCTVSVPIQSACKANGGIIGK